MVVHLVDGTYELFRHFYGRRSGGKLDGEPFGAAAGVLHTVLQMLETGSTHVGVATDHVIESFRNDLWPGYKDGSGVDPALRAQFEPLEEGLSCEDADVQQVCIWTPDKDLAQCVRGDRVVQVDRRSNSVRNADGVREKFGVDPVRIPDLLALVGDTADGYPGIPGIGKVGAARLVNTHGGIEEFPPGVLGDRRDLALLFKDLATLRSSASVLRTVDELRWRGPAPEFAASAERLGDSRLLERALAVADRLPQA
jgi:5'-3' exonuclease